MFALRRACPRVCHGRAWYRTAALPPLPPLEDWKTEFPVMGFTHRVTLKNRETADKIAKAFFKDPKNPDDQNEEGKIVIEAFPGPGCLTRSLLKLPKQKIKKLIILEDAEHYLKYLTPLEAADPRVVVVPLNGYEWSTYSELEDRGLLNDVVTKSWNETPPNLHFVAHIPNAIMGEQLTNQFFRHIPERSWLFKYGRVPMSLLLSDYSYRRTSATNKDREYCKLSVIAQATATIKEAVPREKLQPYKEHFHPLGSGSEKVERKGNYRPPGSPYVALQVNPLIEPVIGIGELDKWDYVSRRLFILRNTPIRRAISSLGPGASNLLPILNDQTLPRSQRLDIDKNVRELKMQDWQILVKVFEEWPFRPDDLHISDAITKDIERER